METKGFFRFKIIRNDLVSPFRLIWIPMLWVYGHYKGVFFSAWTDSRRQILASRVGLSSVWWRDIDVQLWLFTWRRLHGYIFHFVCKFTYSSLPLLTSTGISPAFTYESHHITLYMSWSICSKMQCSILEDSKWEPAGHPPRKSIEPIIPFKCPK